MRAVAPRRPSSKPPVTAASPNQVVGASASPSSGTAASAAIGGTSAVIMVLRTAPKVTTTWVKAMPATTIDNKPWKTPWNKISDQGAAPRRLSTHPAAAASA